MTNYSDRALQYHAYIDEVAKDIIKALELRTPEDFANDEKECEIHEKIEDVISQSSWPCNRASMVLCFSPNEYAWDAEKLDRPSNHSTGADVLRAMAHCALVADVKVRLEELAETIPNEVTP